MTIFNRKWLVLLAGLIFFILDRLFKYSLIYSSVFSGQKFIHYFENKNLAFSLPLATIFYPFFYFFVILIILIVFYLLVVSWRRDILPQVIGYWLILMGAISNLIDRFRFQAVIDYIDFGFWPVFNLADVMIVIGIIFLLFELFHYKKTSP